MLKLIMSIFGIISFLTLVAYDFMCVCRIIKKEHWVKKIWRDLVGNIPYDENMIFIIIRPLFLSISFLTFMLSGGVFWGNPIIKLLLYSAPSLAFLVLITNIRNQ